MMAIMVPILQKNGFLFSGRVSSIKQEIITSYLTMTATFYSLKISYSQSSSGQLPKKIVVKVTKPEAYIVGRKEADFYNSIINTKTILPLITCYGTKFSPETKQYYLLLDDLTHSHNPPAAQWPLPPIQKQCEEAIAVLAEIHSYGWDNFGFIEPHIEQPSEKTIQQRLQQDQKLFPQFVDFLGDRLSAKRIQAYEILFSKLGELMWSRLSFTNRLTLLHGDAHFWNFLYPNNEDNRCVIIDWALWKIGLGAFDLSYMIALHFYAEQRQRMEKPLLKYYLEELQKQNVNYDWNNFWTDYRISVIYNLLWPIRQLAWSLPPVVWFANLEKGFAAFDDLNCLEFM